AAGGADGCSGITAAHRVHEYRESAAGARRRAGTRNGRARLAWRGPLSAVAPGVDRVRAALLGGQPARDYPRLFRDKCAGEDHNVFAWAGAHRTAGNARGGSAAVHRWRRPADRLIVRTGARVARVIDRPGIFVAPISEVRRD